MGGRRRINAKTPQLSTVPVLSEPKAEIKASAARDALLEECEQLPLSNHFLLAEELTNADIAQEELEPIGVPPESLAGRILARGLQATVIARCSRRQYEALQHRNHNTATRVDYQRYLLVRFGLPGPRTTRKIASSPIGLRRNKPWILST